MARRYKLGAGTRLINRWFGLLTRMGAGASYRHILIVRGRRTGQLRSTPVDVLEVGGARWLVAGYGPANWVGNARAAGEVSLRRGRHTTHYRVREADAAEAIPVLRDYLRRIRVTRRYFDAVADASDAAIAAELTRHPVLRLIPTIRG
jgi:deazaflavin-dependent oxidoreductase (nitroreductase family)